MGHPLITGLAVWSSAPPVHTFKSPLVLNSAHSIFLCQLSMHNLCACVWVYFEGDVRDFECKCSPFIVWVYDLDRDRGKQVGLARVLIFNCMCKLRTRS